LSPILLSPGFFCYRAWECALGQDQPFKPWFVWRGLANGDLSNMAGVPQLKRYHEQVFSTDEYGFRNSPGQMDRRPQVVIVGDSFAAGADVSNDEMLDAMIEKETGLVVYSFATSRLRTFYNDRHFMEHPPRWVIAFHVERELSPKLFKLPLGDKPFAPPRFADAAAYERGLRPGVRGRWKEMRESISRHSLLTYLGERALKGSLWALGLYEFPEQIYHYDAASGFLFFEPSVRDHLDPSEMLSQLEVTVAAIRDAEYKLAARGIRLIVLIAPDKETIYHARIPALRDRPVTLLLDRLDAELTRYDIAHVPAHRLLAAHLAARPDQDLYFSDDTHFTPLGHRVLLQGLLPLLQPVR